MKPNWHKRNRPVGTYWLHDTHPTWVVFYSASHVRAAHYQGYKAIEKVPKGRNAWTVDNRRIGSEMGFLTLEDAMTACEAAFD